MQSNMCAAAAAARQTCLICSRDLRLWHQFVLLPASTVSLIMCIVPFVPWICWGLGQDRLTGNPSAAVFSTAFVVCRIKLSAS